MIGIFRRNILQIGIRRYAKARESVTPKVDPVESKKIAEKPSIKSNIIGNYYKNLQIQGKGGKHLPLERLRDLLVQCTEPNHINYIKHGVQLWQVKGQDFSEDIASHFIRACLRVDNPKVAAEICAKYKNRIGAWVTPKSLDPLIEKLIEKGDTVIAVAMMETISKKGVIASKNTIELLINSLSKDETLRTSIPTMLVVASKMLSKEDYESIVSKYPVSTPINESTT